MVPVFRLRGGFERFAILALNEHDLPFAMPDFLVAVFAAQRLKETDAFQLVQGRLQLFLDLGGGIIAAKPDMFTCEIAEVEFLEGIAVKPLVEKAVCPFGGGKRKLEVERQVEAFQVL